jgi:formylglycine-generating enzyme required for sulfatase activity
MVYVPAGDFLMGSQQDDPGMDVDELPQHSVYLDPFWIDQVEVTNAMFVEFLNEMGNQLEGRLPWLDAVDEDVQIFQVDGIWKPLNSLQDYPVVEVTWFGASAYCHWAGKRLPTEAEWEKAARGAQARTYPWGEDIDCQHANYANCGRQKAVPVGSLPEGVSPYGALEMAANLWEWVSDWYAPDYYANSPVDNPVGPENGQFRVLRGGSFGHDWKHARSANRRNNAPTNSQHDYGFRCAMSTMP